MPSFAIGAKAPNSNAVAAREEAPQFEKVNWRKEPNMRKLYFWACVLCVASATTGYDGMMLNSSQQMERWANYFDKPDDNRLGIMNNAYNIGSIASFFIVPFVAEWWGRKVPIAIGCVIMIAGALVSTFSTNWKIYLAGRLILGFGNSFAQMCSPILLTEICHPQHRGRFTAIYNCLWNLGAVFVAWVAWGTSQADNEWSWRSITLLQGLPSLIQLSLIWWVPESPRWLISKERYEEALSMLAYYHANGNQNDATVQFEYQEMKETIRMEVDASKNSSYLDFIKTRGNRWRLAILISLGIISQYSGNALFSNYINLVYEGAGITSQSQKMGLTGGERILQLGVSVYAATLIDKVGRRKLFLIATSGMVINFICWTITSAIYENSNELNAGAGYAQIPFIWVFGVFYSLAWSGLLVAYALEILPYRLRGKGLMIMNITVQAILAVGGQTNPVAWKRLPHHWNLALFYTLWICVELVWVYFVYPETKGPTLEEIGRIFDGDSAVAHIDMKEVEREIEERDVLDEKVPQVAEKRV
ncbi:hexose transporter-like protein [Macroventuria anomochaeta]|uniref:Hexose transporter-like protein n=1 Tax=Macroventuria anomochaeta TaxID=301207 RepID=A0ACB6S3I7_9PLEO|nr:hexose transporter-like protein [Macroventuria anomochaeta]KAF2627759.1 hexose transporter-like protein [Macroventuria anomochaeta]